MRECRAPHRKVTAVRSKSLIGMDGNVRTTTTHYIRAAIHSILKCEKCCSTVSAVCARVRGEMANWIYILAKCENVEYQIDIYILYLDVGSHIQISAHIVRSAENEIRLFSSSISSSHTLHYVQCARIYRQQFWIILHILQRIGITLISLYFLLLCTRWFFIAAFRLRRSEVSPCWPNDSYKLIGGISPTVSERCVNIFVFAHFFRTNTVNTRERESALIHSNVWYMKRNNVCIDWPQSITCVLMRTHEEN